jgi:hypothetical protein
MKRQKILSLLLFSLFCIASLYASNTSSYTANYQQEPFIQFVYGNPPVLDGVSNTGIEDSYFTALLGVVTVTPNGNQTFQPEMFSLGLESNLYIEGYTYVGGWPNVQYNNAIPVHIRAITVISGNVEQSVIVSPGEIPLGPANGNVTPGGASMLIYLVLENSTGGPSYFIPGTSYRLTDGSNVGFFSVSATVSQNKPNEIIPITLNGGTTMDDDAPFIGETGEPTTIPDIPYEGDFEFEYYFELTILERFENFDLQTALMGIPQVIARLQLQVFLAAQNTEYGVEIAFSSSDPAGFTLHLNGDISEHGFPYRLFLGNTEISNNVLMVWNQLYTQNDDNASATKDVSVLVESSSLVENAPQGFYKDTVTVLIVPLDTM